MGAGVFELDPTFPALDATLFKTPTQSDLAVREPSRHAPRFLMLYGSLRERSYSRLLTQEAARLLTAMGGEVRIFEQRRAWPSIFRLQPEGRDMRPAFRASALAARAPYRPGC
jgi:hypothetical protein